MPDTALQLRCGEVLAAIIVLGEARKSGDQICYLKDQLIFDAAVTANSSAKAEAIKRLFRRLQAPSRPTEISHEPTVKPQ